jgi:dTDP-4-amino-4,6-dideoxygalactose transaminase
LDFFTDLEKVIAAKFEKEYCCLTGSGTTAIYILLKTLLSGKNKTVMMPSICCLAPAYAIKYAGFMIDFCDINLDDGNSYFEDIKNRIDENPGIKILIGVHLYGNSLRDIDSIIKLCKGKNIFFIEDAAVANGTFLNGKRCGSFGEASILSFGGDKLFNIGFGGALLSNDKHIIEDAKKQLSYLPEFNEDVVRNTYNLHRKRYNEIRDSNLEVSEKNKSYQKLFDGFQNAFLFKADYNSFKQLDSFFEKEEEISGHRKKIRDLYFTHLSKIDCLDFITQRDSVPWRFSFRIKESSKKLGETLRKKNYIVSHWYPDLSARFKETESSKLPNSKIFEKEITNLLNNESIDEDYVNQICKSIKNELVTILN